MVLSGQRAGGHKVMRRGSGALSVLDGWSWCLKVLSLDLSTFLPAGKIREVVVLKETSVLI